MHGFGREVQCDLFIQNYDWRSAWTLVVPVEACLMLCMLSVLPGLKGTTEEEKKVVEGQ